MKNNVFAELKLGKSTLKYLSNGKLTYSGWQGPALFAAVMHHAHFFGRGNALPAMVAVKKILDKAQITINWDNKPSSKLDALQTQFKEMASDAGREAILHQIHEHERHSPEVDWEIARRMLEDQDAGI